MSSRFFSFRNVCRLGLVTFATACALTNVANESARADDLTIGSPAPALDIEYWVSDRDGEFKHTTEFEDGKVYVVEFWATWCGPCIASMPHLAEMQDEYAKKGVQLISVSDEKLSKVEKFLKKTVRGEDELTYGELTGAYCLTTDPDESVYKDYMRAANQNGIPTAFIVGKTGLVEWIGHPMRMDKPLASVVEGDWDRKKFAVAFAKEQEFGTLAPRIIKMMQEGESEEALAKLDEFMGDLDKDGMIYQQCGSLRLAIAMQVGGPEALKAFKEMTSKSDNALMINQYAWSIVEQVQAGDEIELEMLEAACMAAKKAVALAKKEGDDESTAAVLDTHANLLFLCDKLDEAIKVQEEAVELSDDEQITDFYEKLLDAKEDGDSEEDDDAKEDGDGKKDDDA